MIVPLHVPKHLVKKRLSSTAGAFKGNGLGEGCSQTDEYCFVAQKNEFLLSSDAWPVSSQLLYP
jgi:hypothetical protein